MSRKPVEEAVYDGTNIAEVLRIAARGRGEDPADDAFADATEGDILRTFPEQTDAILAGEKFKVLRFKETVVLPTVMTDAYGEPPKTTEPAP